jgi:hypothetical protein
MKKPTAGELGILANQNFIYGLIVLFFIFYLLSGLWVFGLLVGLSILWVVLLEFWIGASEHGWKSELKETGLALLLAAAIWFGAGFVLHTSSPLNAIVSCSMLPHIQRGDMVVLSGDRLKAPLEEISSLDGIGTAQVYMNGSKVGTFPGSIYSYCAQHQGYPICNSFITDPEAYTEKQGQLTFGYERCEILYPKTGLRQTGPCVSWLEVNGKRYSTDLSNDVAVYQPAKDEYYAIVGDIIHRAFIKLQVGNETYFLTKGDNNPIFDIQVFDERTGKSNRPVEIERLKGRVLATVPVVGYLKLFISPAAIITPEGCDRYYAKYENK